jgi:hypothetical protein
MLMCQTGAAAAAAAAAPAQQSQAECLKGKPKFG